jgi:2'-5' RNA ligase
MSSNRPEPSRRLFFALWPTGEVRAAVDHFSRHAIRKRAKRVPARNLHITLAFAGSVPNSVQACLEAGADEIRGEAFGLHIDTVGYWPRPRIIWLGPAQSPPAAWHLVRSLREVLLACELQPEARGWQPHITLARKAGRGLESGKVDPIDWSISDFCLVESVTEESGPSYRILRRWLLEGQTGSM